MSSHTTFTQYGTKYRLNLRSNAGSTSHSAIGAPQALALEKLREAMHHGQGICMQADVHAAGRPLLLYMDMRCRCMQREIDL